MNNNNVSNNPGFRGLFSGNDKYISGLLIIIANVIGFVSHFRKAKYSVFQTYSMLIVVIVIGSFLAKI
jgi:hypothetical protein